jgi:hypothetical protein
MFMKPKLPTKKKF